MWCVWGVRDVWGVVCEGCVVCGVYAWSVICVECDLWGVCGVWSVLCEGCVWCGA